MMNVLLLTQVVPYPPESGPRIKTLNVLRYLAQRHNVHLVSFVRSEREAADAQTLADYCSGITTVPIKRSRVRDISYLGRSLLSGRPFLVERDDSRAMRVPEDAGSMPYSAVIQPLPVPRRNGGVRSSSFAVQMTRVSPTSISTEPSACLV